MTRQATVLQQNQIDDFWARGFLTVEDLFSPAEVTALREATEFEAIRGPQNERGYAEHTVHLLELTVRHPLFMELAKNERILSLIRPLIGNDIQLQHSKIASKPPAKDSGPYRWHQDFAFFPHSNSSLVAAMVMLDDSTPRKWLHANGRRQPQTWLARPSQERRFQRMPAIFTVGRPRRTRTYHAARRRHQHTSLSNLARLAAQSLGPTPTRIGIPISRRQRLSIR